MVRGLRDQGVTSLLTTHYIEEAEQIADRVGVIHKGELVLVEETHSLIRRMGQRQLVLHLMSPLQQLPAALAPWAPPLPADGMTRHCNFSQDITGAETAHLLQILSSAAIAVRDLQTQQSSLEEIFVQLVQSKS